MLAEWDAPRSAPAPAATPTPAWRAEGADDGALPVSLLIGGGWLVLGCWTWAKGVKGWLPITSTGTMLYTGTSWLNGMSCVSGSKGATSREATPLSSPLPYLLEALG
jgi:hypothetical protein